MKRKLVSFCFTVLPWGIALAILIVFGCRNHVIP